jgi:hypothetical protein
MSFVSENLVESLNSIGWDGAANDRVLQAASFALLESKIGVSQPTVDVSSRRC